MCDTLGKLTPTGGIFAKNSDRSPNEVQVLEYHPARTGLTGDVACTYCTIPQVEHTHAVLLSRPEWMWGAEIGVNEFGLCIGNEAVFTKGAYGQTGLTGMDLLRLALERCRTAQEALGTIIQLLETYGQGGNCGFDHKFYYDNAFLIQDPQHLYVLETAGKNWAWKHYDAVSISNRLSLGADADCYSGRRCNFKRKYTEPVFTTFSGSASRKAQTGKLLSCADTLQGAMAALGSHKKNAKPFTAGSVASSCMHYGGAVGDHTTASMVVSLEPDRTVVWSTGCSLPCVSLFKPWLFGATPILPVVSPGDTMGKRYWMEAENFRRTLIGKKLPDEYYTQLQQIQQRWIQTAPLVSREEFPAFSSQCLAEETAFYRQWLDVSLPEAPCGKGFRNRWEKKNQALSKEGIR